MYHSRDIRTIKRFSCDYITTCSTGSGSHARMILPSRSKASTATLPRVIRIGASQSTVAVIALGSYSIGCNVSVFGVDSVEVRSHYTMSRVAIAVVTFVVFMSVVDQSLAVSTRANIRLVNNGYEDILIAIAETVPVSESGTILRRLKVGTHSRMRRVDRHAYFVA